LRRTPHDARVVEGRSPVRENRPLSALICDLEPPSRLSRNSFGIVVFSARPAEPELRPDHPDSPRINTGQEMVFGK
jgi:hypothetical protein